MLMFVLLKCLRKKWTLLCF